MKMLRLRFEKPEHKREILKIRENESEKVIYNKQYIQRRTFPF